MGSQTLKEKTGPGEITNLSSVIFRDFAAGTCSEDIRRQHVQSVLHTTQDWRNAPGWSPGSVRGIRAIETSPSSHPLVVFGDPGLGALLVVKRSLGEVGRDDSLPLHEDGAAQIALVVRPHQNLRRLIRHLQATTHFPEPEPSFRNETCATNPQYDFLFSSWTRSLSDPPGSKTNGAKKGREWNNENG